MPARYSTDQRIDQFVLNTRRAANGCTEWQRSHFKNGYGRVKTVGRRVVGTHREAYTLFVGPIPDGLFVLHRCDNRRCVSPAHFFIGDAGDNIRDCVAKGRHVPGGVKGEDHPFAKLTDAAVLEIRRRHATGEGPTSIAAAFHTPISTVNRIVHRQTWRHLP